VRAITQDADRGQRLAAASSPARCVGNYIREGHLMLMEGVPPAMIENCAARMAGMPVGPLSLNDSNT
jgi:hypothetical protein